MPQHLSIVLDHSKVWPSIIQSSFIEFNTEPSIDYTMVLQLAWYKMNERVLWVFGSLKARLDDAWSNLAMVQDNAQVLWQEFLASLLSAAEQADEKKKVAKL